MATEAQYKTRYSVSIVALEEAKGTLLEYDNIVVIEPVPRPTAGQPAAPIPGSQINTAAVASMPAPAITPSQQPKPDSQTKTASALLPQNPFAIANSPVVPPSAAAEHPIPPVPTRPASKSKDAETDVKAKPTTWTFSISIGGAHPFVITGAISPGEPAQAAAYDD